MAVVSMKQLLESGVHFGHQTRRWNPKMDKYIYTSRNGIHIIDLQKTVVYIEDVYQRFLEIAKDGGKVLFVGTKKQASDVIAEEATRANQFYVSKRWLGGTLTNFKTIRKSIRRLHQIKQMEKDGTFERLPKKEVIGLRKELARLEAFLGGIQEMRTLPDAVFIVDPRKERNAILEAKKLGIPVFGMVDTNCDPDEIDFIIPANDDAIRSIKVIVSTMANAMVEGGGGDVPVPEVTTEEKPERRPERRPSPDRRDNRPQRTPRPQQTRDSSAQGAPKRPATQNRQPYVKKEVTEKVEPTVKKEVIETVEPTVKKEVIKKVEPIVKKEVAPKKTEPVKTPQAKVEAPKADTVSFDELTVVDLRELAKEKGLTGYSKLKKAELIEALKA